MIALVAIMVIGVMVGVAIYPPPKAARASKDYSVWIHNGNNGLNCVNVQMRFKVNQVWGNWVNAAGGYGLYSHTEDSDIWEEWQVKVNDANFVPVSPDTNPCTGGTGYSLDWSAFFD